MPGFPLVVLPAAGLFGTAQEISPSSARAFLDGGVYARVEVLNRHRCRDDALSDRPSRRPGGLGDGNWMLRPLVVLRHREPTDRVYRASVVIRSSKNSSSF